MTKTSSSSLHNRSSSGNSNSSSSRSSSTSGRKKQMQPSPAPPSTTSSTKSSSSKSSSSLEKSCFVCHLFLIPIVATIVGLWIVYQDEPQRLNETVGYIQLPHHPHYIQHIPVSFVFIFFAVPLLYCTVNSFIVPNLQTTEILYDQYTTKTTTTTEHNQSGLPPQ